MHKLICRDFNSFKFRWRSKCCCRNFPMLPKHPWGKHEAVVTRNQERFNFGKQCWLMWSSTARNQYFICLRKPIDQTRVNNPAKDVWYFPRSPWVLPWVCACVCEFKPGRWKRNNCLEEHIMFFLAWVLHLGWAVEFLPFDVSKLMINSPRILHEFPWLSSLRPHAYRTHLDGTISVLALSTRREWRPRLELPRRYSGLGSWWSALFYNA